MTTYIYSYNPHSASAKALAEALEIKRIKHHNSKYKPKADDVIINWGSSILPDIIEIEAASGIFNESNAVKFATNKLSFFEMIDPELTVPYVAGVHAEAQVRAWLDGGKTVVARQKLTGHSGDGIVVFDKLYVDNGNPVPPAPLYTLYVPKKEEYRVHVAKLPTLVRGFSESVIFDIQRKAKRNDIPKEEANYRIRNLAGGFIYARQELDVPECVEDVALKVFEQTGLDFGAVDIIYNEKQDRAYALEVNTAPGLTGTTLEKYVEMFKELL